MPNNPVPRWLQILGTLAVVWGVIYATRDWLLIPLVGLYNIAASVFGSDVTIYVVVIVLPGTGLFLLARYTRYLLGRIERLEYALGKLFQEGVLPGESRNASLTRMKTRIETADGLIAATKGRVAALESIQLAIAVSAYDNNATFGARLDVLLDGAMDHSPGDLDEDEQRERKRFLQVFKDAMHPFE